MYAFLHGGITTAVTPHFAIAVVYGFLHGGGGVMTESGVPANRYAAVVLTSRRVPTSLHANDYTMVTREHTFHVANARKVC